MKSIKYYDIVFINYFIVSIYYYYSSRAITTRNRAMSDLDSNLQVLDAKARQDQLTEQAKAEARARHNHNKFLQIDKKAIAELRKLMVQHVGACNVLMMLAEKMNRQNAIVMSYDAMMKMTGYSKSSITKAIAVLKKRAVD